MRDPVSCINLMKGRIKDESVPFMFGLFAMQYPVVEQNKLLDYKINLNAYKH